MARFKITFSVPNRDPRTPMSAYNNSQYTIVEAFNAPAAQQLVKAQYPGAVLHGVQTLQG